jgi:hypothetical protein
MDEFGQCLVRGVDIDAVRRSPNERPPRRLPDFLARRHV